MGKIGRALFGGPEKSRSYSGNHNNRMLQSSLSPALGYVGQGGNLMANLLGANGGEAQTQALSNYANSGGMKFLLGEGVDEINSNMYSRGLGESGAAMKGLEKFRSGLASTYLNQYMNHAKDLAGIGLGAGGILSDSGRYSRSKSTGKKKGIAQSIGEAYAAGGGGGG